MILSAILLALKDALAWCIKHWQAVAAGLIVFLFAWQFHHIGTLKKKIAEDKVVIEKMTALVESQNAAIDQWKRDGAIADAKAGASQKTALDMARISADNVRQILATKIPQDCPGAVDYLGRKSAEVIHGQPQRH